MRNAKPPKVLPPIRVRHEPPTVQEAVFAAQGLTDDLDQQVRIAAELMGLPEDQVRPHATGTIPRPWPGRPARPGAPTPRVVVVERRSRALPGR